MRVRAYWDKFDNDEDANDMPDLINLVVALSAKLSDEACLRREIAAHVVALRDSKRRP